MSTATNGRAREYRVRDHMIANGWTFVMRSAGSKGAADLLMVDFWTGLALVQVGTASKSLGPVDRQRFVAISEACGALPLLATCSPGKRPKYHVVTRNVPSTWEEFEL